MKTAASNIIMEQRIGIENREFGIQMRGEQNKN